MSSFEDFTVEQLREIYSEENVNQIKLDIFNEAEKLPIYELEDPYDSSYTLIFDDWTANVSLQRWSPQELRPERGALLFRVDSTDGLEVSVDSKTDNFIIVDGASVENYMTNETQGVLAKDCNINFRKVTTELIDYSHLNDFELEEQLNTDERLKSAGLVRYYEGHQIRLLPSVISEFTLPLRQVLYGKDSKQAFSVKD